MKALIVGGGIIGASCAWRLASEGVAVTVLERGRLGQEASWAAAGLIGPQGEADKPGPFFDLCMAGKESFDRSVEPLAKESGIDPEYDHHGMLSVAFSEHERDELTARARWQRAAGGEDRGDVNVSGAQDGARAVAENHLRAPSSDQLADRQSQIDPGLRRSGSESGRPLSRGRAYRFDCDEKWARGERRHPRGRNYRRRCHHQRRRVVGERAARAGGRQNPLLSGARANPLLRGASRHYRAVAVFRARHPGSAPRRAFVALAPSSKKPASTKLSPSAA